MPMKRLFATLLCALPVLFCGCSEEEDVLPEQRRRIVSYLESTHLPALIPESEVEQGSHQACYTVSGSTVYRYIDVTQYYDPNRETLPEVTPNSIVTLVFGIHIFNYTNIPATQLPLYSNDANLAEDYYRNGLTPGAWPFEPLTINMREGGILNGLRDALLGCREGDYVEAYMTYNMAYGDKYFGTIPRESPIAVFFTVRNIE